MLLVFQCATSESRVVERTLGSHRSLQRAVRRISVILTLAPVSLSGLSCSSNKESPGVSRACDAGHTRVCVGPGACPGGQACLPDGSGWTSCDCGGEAGTGGATVGGTGGGAFTGGQPGTGASGQGGNAAGGDTSGSGGRAASGGSSGASGDGGADPGGTAGDESGGAATAGGVGGGGAPASGGTGLVEVTSFVIIDPLPEHEQEAEELRASSPEVEAFTVARVVDGGVVIGRSGVRNGVDREMLFRWTEESGAVGLGLPDDVESARAWHISDWSESSAVIVGNATMTRSDSDLTESFHWSQNTGLVSPTPGLESASPPAVSADGSVMVGWAATDNPGGNAAFRRSEVTGFEPIGTALIAPERILATSDGSLIWGANRQGYFVWTEDGTTAYNEFPSDACLVPARTRHAPLSVAIYCTLSAESERMFVWSEDSGWIEPGTLPGFTQIIPRAIVSVPGRGSLVAGEAVEADGIRPYRWTQEGSFVLLGAEESSVVDAMSADGSVIVGTQIAAQRAFRWTESEGTMELLPLLDDSMSRALSVSPDGSLVVGESWGDGARTTVLWDRDGSVHALLDLLSEGDFALPDGWTPGEASFAPDGTLFATATSTLAWIAEVE